jgi:hypothetical protein
MGNILKLIGFGLAIVGIGLSLALPWWHSDLFGQGTIDITLRKAEICATGGDCHSVPAGGMYGIIAMMTMAYGAVALIMITLGGFVPALAGDSTRPMAVIGGIVYLMLAGFTYGSLDLPDEVMMGLDLHTTWAFKVGIVGAALAMCAPLFGYLEPKRKPEAYRPPEPRPDRPGRISSLPPIGEPGPLPERTRAPSRAPLAPIAIDLEGPATPEPAAATRSALRFAIASADVREDVLVAVGEDGARRQISWNELGGALARELVAPHLTLLVDLVPAGTAPLRFVNTTTLTFSSGGKDRGDPRDGLRRLLAFARAMHPEIELEAATTDFLYKRSDLPVWTSDDLDRYDARYQ